VTVEIVENGAHYLLDERPDAVARADRAPRALGVISL